MYKGFALATTLALLVAVPAGAQEIYRWVDADGVVHYSDQPPAETATAEGDVERVALDVPPGISDPTRAARASAPNSNIGGSADPTDPNLLLAQQQAASVGAAPVGRAARVEYTAASIARPAADETLWNIATQLRVNVSVTPGLGPGDQVQLILDGQPAGEPEASLSRILTPVYRGTHTLRAAVVDDSGNTVFRGEPITFYVQQTTINRPGGR